MATVKKSKMKVGETPGTKMIPILMDDRFLQGNMGTRLLDYIIWWAGNEPSLKRSGTIVVRRELQPTDIHKFLYTNLQTSLNLTMPQGALTTTRLYSHRGQKNIISGTDGLVNLQNHVKYPATVNIDAYQQVRTDKDYHALLLLRDIYYGGSVLEVEDMLRAIVKELMRKLSSMKANSYSKKNLVVIVKLHESLNFMQELFMRYYAQYGKSTPQAGFLVDPGITTNMLKMRSIEKDLAVKAQFNILGEDCRQHVGYIPNEGISDKKYGSLQIFKNSSLLGRTVLGGAKVPTDQILDLSDFPVSSFGKSDYLAYCSVQRANKYNKVLSEKLSVLLLLINNISSYY